MRRLPAAAVFGLGVVLGVFGTPGVAGAHPLGNFSVNVYSGMRISPTAVAVALVVDMAEIPAFQERRQVDAAGPAYASQACSAAARQVQLWVDGSVVPLRLGTSEVAFPPGTGGLPTLRLACALRGPVADRSGSREVKFRNRLYDDRVGWREITAVGDGTSLVSSDVPSTSVSAALTAYPDDLLSSPLRATEASVRARPGGARSTEESIAGRALGLPKSADAASGRFVALVGRDLTVGAGALALLAAVVLGGLHSLAPGHGKTLMAAYLVGRRGSARQAAVIGLTVTLTHTAGVLVLGVALSAFTSFAPDRVYPWFAIASGLLVAAIGVNLVRGARARRHHPDAHTHSHDDEHELVLAGARSTPHSHGHRSDHTHDHVPSHPSAEKEPTRRSLVVMGLAGGMVPTPSAVLVLLAAIGLGRAWFGVVLVMAYGIGMAVTLTGAGLLLARASSVVERRLRPGARPARLAALSPMISAAAVVAIGLVLTVRGAFQL